MKQFIPKLLKQKLKQVMGIEPLNKRIDDLESAMGLIKQENQILKDLYQYSVLKPVDLVRYYGTLFFWYVNDISYQWISKSPPPLVIKNYHPTPEDLSTDYFGTGNALEEYENFLPFILHRQEQELKQILFLYLWINEINFIFIDIGANYGNTAIPAAKFFKKHGKQNPIISFEPGITFELLQKNTIINHVSDIVNTQKIAASDQTSVSVINSLLNHSECNSLQDFRKFYPDLTLARCEVVETTTLDDYLTKNSIDQPLIVKIDAEGHDYQVLMGMKEALKTQVMIMIVEFDPKYLQAFIEPNELLELFSDAFVWLNMRDLDESMQWRYNLVSDQILFTDFTQAVRESPAGWTDMLAIRKTLPNLNEFIHKIT